MRKTNTTLIFESETYGQILIFLKEMKVVDVFF